MPDWKVPSRSAVYYKIGIFHGDFYWRHLGDPVNENELSKTRNKGRLWYWKCSSSNDLREHNWIASHYLCYISTAQITFLQDFTSQASQDPNSSIFADIVENIFKEGFCIGKGKQVEVAPPNMFLCSYHFQIMEVLARLQLFRSGNRPIRFNFTYTFYSRPFRLQYVATVLSIWEMMIHGRSYLQ